VRIVPLERPPDAMVRVPGSKSLTNRALVCALLAEGTSTITGALVSEDTTAMSRAVEVLGATVTWEGTTVTVEGTGGELRPGPLDLDVHQAGTAARFLAPVLAQGRGPYRLDGDDQLRRRPMGPMIEALRSLGVVVREEGEPGHLPVVVEGRGEPLAGRVEVAADVSSQFVSGLLLVGIEVVPTTEVVSAPYIRMTEAVRDHFGGKSADFRVEPDATAATYFWAAGALFPEGCVEVEGVGPDSLQGDVGFLDVLARRPLGRVDLRDMPDTAPTLAVVAACAPGETTTVEGIAFVRHHETDRIAAVVSELQRCGVDAIEHDDGFTVVGGTPHGSPIRTYGDHRMAMSFAVLGLRVDGIDIDDPGCVAKTFPGFFDVLEGLRR
jgi:3-phosphoshikimate 1-carboxyvinyltransferase